VSLQLRSPRPVQTAAGLYRDHRLACAAPPKFNPHSNPAVVISRHFNAEPPRAHFYLHVRGWRAGRGHDEIAGQSPG